MAPNHPPAFDSAVPASGRSLRQRVFAVFLVPALVGAVGGAVGGAGGTFFYDLQRTNPETVAAEPTFTARYTTDAWRTEGGAMVYPRSPSMDELPYVSPQQGCTDFPTNGYTEGGVDFQRSVVDLYAHGAHGRTLLIDGISAEIVETNPPSGGTITLCSLEGEGDKTGIAIDLDSLTRSALELDARGTGPTNTPYSAEGFHTLTDKEPHIFRVWAFASISNYKWSLVVTGTLDGEHRRWPVKDPDTGKTAVFHTAGRSDDFTHVYTWKPEEPWWFEVDGADIPVDPLACMPYRYPPAPHC